METEQFFEYLKPPHPRRDLEVEQREKRPLAPGLFMAQMIQVIQLDPLWETLQELASSIPLDVGGKYLSRSPTVALAAAFLDSNCVDGSVQSVFPLSEGLSPVTTKTERRTFSNESKGCGSIKRFKIIIRWLLTPATHTQPVKPKMQLHMRPHQPGDPPSGGGGVDFAQEKARNSCFFH